MILRSLELERFRNFTHKEIEFCDAINVIYGLNGYGKTNLLEAISVACLSRSFRTRNDNELVHFEESNFKILADIGLDGGLEKRIQISYNCDHGKEILIDHTKTKSIAELVGSFPIVVMAPESDSVTTGPPQERRRFLNILLSQIDREYLKLLQDYVRILKQRNRLLQNARENRYKFSEKVQPWNEKLYTISRTITEKRSLLLKELEKSATPIHMEITSHLERFSIQYRPSFNLEWDKFEKFEEILNKNINLEIVRGATMVGPHRDEIQFFLNGKELRKFGSRGQHRCCLLAIKIGEYKLLQEKRSETPIFLLDDVYSEIDEVREKALNDYFLDLKQIFLTTHESDIKLDTKPEFGKEIKYYHIQDNSFAYKEMIS